MWCLSTALKERQGQPCACGSAEGLGEALGHVPGVFMEQRGDRQGWGPVSGGAVPGEEVRGQWGHDGGLEGHPDAREISLCGTRGPSGVGSQVVCCLGVSACVSNHSLKPCQSLLAGTIVSVVIVRIWV